MAERRRFRLPALLVPLILALCVWAAASAETAPPEGYADYTLMAENDGWAMFASPQTLSVLVVDRATGLSMCSTLPAGGIPSKPKAIDGASYSGAVILARNGTSISSSEQVDLLRTENTVTWEPVENGFRAGVRIGEPYLFDFDAVVTLEGSDLVVTVPDDSVAEHSPTYTISWINLFPMMGATDQKDDP